MDRVLLVRDLKSYLETQGVSPEKFAKDVGLSHMTIRRWLKRPADEPIPKKYYPLIGTILSPGSGMLDVETMMREIEKSGKDFKDFETLDRDLTQKLNGTRLDRVFADYCKRLFRFAKTPGRPLRKKAIAIGALLYFISPVDLIPDTVPVVGYVDDLAVLCLAVEMIGDSAGESALGTVGAGAGRKSERRELAGVEASSFTSGRGGRPKAQPDSG